MASRHQRGSTIMFLSSDGYRFEAKIDGTTLRITDGYTRKVRVYRQVEDVPRDTVLPRSHAALPFAGERPSVRLVPIFPEADGTTGSCG